jgi:hypothetical protein
VAGQYVGGAFLNTGDLSQAAGTNAIMMSKTISAVNGQQYRVVYQSTHRFTNTGSTSVMQLKHVSGASITTAAANFRTREIWSLVTSEHNTLVIEGIFTATATGNYTVGLASNFFSGTGTLFHGSSGNNEQSLDIFALQ